MRLRKEQIEAFSAAARQEFEDRMVEHLNEFFPRHCKAMGEEGVRQEIRHGVARARTYEITSQRDVCKYIDLAFVYGRDFDTNPKLPWAGRILNDPSFINASERTSELFETGREFLQKNPRASQKIGKGR